MCVHCAGTLLVVDNFSSNRDLQACRSYMSDGDDDPATAPIPPGTPGDIQPPADPVSPQWHPPVHKPTDPTRSAFVRSSLIAAALGTFLFLIAGVLSAAGAAAVQPFVFLLMIASGGLAVTLYTRKVQTGLPAGKGLRLGLLTGFFGALMTMAMSMLSLLSHNSRNQFRQMVTDALNNSAAASPDPAAKDVAARMIASIGTNGGLIAFLLLMMAFVAAIYLILAGIGGAIGATLFGRTPHSEN